MIKWAENNGLKLNAKKTKLLLLGRKRRKRELAQVRVLMGEEAVERSTCVKCLGVMLDDGLSWREQVQNVRKKCFTGLAKLRRLRSILPSKTKKNSYIQCFGTAPPKPRLHD